MATMSHLCIFASTSIPRATTERENLILQSPHHTYSITSINTRLWLTVEYELRPSVTSLVPDSLLAHDVGEELPWSQCGPGLPEERAPVTDSLSWAVAISMYLVHRRLEKEIGICASQMRGFMHNRARNFSRSCFQGRLREVNRVTTSR